MITGRDSLRDRVPRWLRESTGGHILYAIGAHLDAIVDQAIEGVYAGFPGFTTPKTLNEIGRDRRIRRGRDESDITYATRLIRWLDDHPTRGGPYAMLRQLHHYFAPDNFRIELLNVSGRKYNMAADGTITREDVTWTPPGDPDVWARWWLFFFVTDPPGDDGLWGDPGDWGDGGLWGVDATPEELEQYQVVASEWKAAHIKGARVIVLDDTEQWDDYPPGEWPVQIAVR